MIENGENKIEIKLENIINSILKEMVIVQEHLNNG